MPGGGRYQWTWIEGPPLYYKLILWITFAEFAVSWLMIMTVSHWARSTPDLVHPIEFAMKFGRHYYLSPIVGWYLNNNLWIFFGLLTILILITLFHHDKIERIR